jgi:hypothetical protein
VSRTRPDASGALDAFERHLRDLEKSAKREGTGFWEREAGVSYEATNFAFLLRSLRSLLLIVSTQHFLLEDLRSQAVRRMQTPSPDPIPLHTAPKAALHT